MDVGPIVDAASFFLNGNLTPAFFVPSTASDSVALDVAACWRESSTSPSSGDCPRLLDGRASFGDVGSGLLPSTNDEDMADSEDDDHDDGAQW